MMILAETVGSPAGARARRAFDLAVALPAAVVLAPLFALIAFAIWAESGGPILFRQRRLGRGGRSFVMLKFRKFAPDAPPGCPLTQQCDPRMTVLGRVLMATKLDELPQLWNVITGEMAIVGPRPESLAFADCFRGGLERVLDHTPGLLGPCQVLFRNEAAVFPPNSDPERFYREVLFEAKARIDLAYFERRTLWGDVGFLLKGAVAVIAPAAPDSSAVPVRPLVEGGRVTMVSAPTSRATGAPETARAAGMLAARAGLQPSRLLPSVPLRKTSAVPSAHRS